MNISSLSPNIYMQILQTTSKERLREFEKRSKHFSLEIILTILIIFSLDYLMILLRDN